jgi:uncharacterized membrane protein YidH (DUF202 family)
MLSLPLFQSLKFYFLSKTTPQSSGALDDSNIELTETDTAIESEPSSLSWITDMFKRRGYQSIATTKTRKVPTKVEPKVFFANERTFLAWLHMSVTLSSISVAIVAFSEANEFSQIYGLMLMPVAIAFCCYSLYMYMKRSSMIRQRHPGPYEDKLGPIALASMLGLAITVNFCVNLFDVATAGSV